MSTSTKTQFVAVLKSLYPKMDIRDTEDFNGSKGGLWLDGENATEDTDGLPLFNYYSQSNLYEFGVLTHLVELADNHNWLFEWHDSGTILAYPQ